MKKRIFENGIYYVLVGDYYVPELSLPNERPDRLEDGGDSIGSI